MQKNISALRKTSMISFLAIVYIYKRKVVISHKLSGLSTVPLTKLFSSSQFLDQFYKTFSKV